MSFKIAIAITHTTGQVKTQPTEPWRHVISMFIKLLALGVRPMQGDYITDTKGTVYVVHAVLFNQSTNHITVIIEHSNSQF